VQHPADDFALFEERIDAFRGRELQATREFQLRLQFGVGT